MSRRLTYKSAIEMGFLHSPVDDLESCFWVALWSVLFNKSQERSLSELEREIMEDIVNDGRDTGMAKINHVMSEQDCSDIMKRFNPVLVAWWEKVRDRGVRWGLRVGGRYYLPHFHLSALQGVVDVLEVISVYWDGEISWESWTAPAPAS